MRYHAFCLSLTIVLLAGLSISEASDGHDPWTDPPARGFVSRQLATSWEEALICGNGHMGALVMGRPLAETVVFNHERLFMPLDPSQPVIHMAPHLETVRKMLGDGQYAEAADFVGRLARKEGYRGMRWTDPLIPAFELQVSMDPAGKVRDYARSVDFATGVATVRWEDERGVILQRLFVSRADNVAVLSVRGAEAAAVNCRIALRTTPEARDDVEDEEHPGAEDPSTKDEASVGDEEEEDEEDEEAFFSEGIEQVIREVDGPILTYFSRFAKSRPDSIAAYAGVAYVTTTGGSVTTNTDNVVVADADELVVLIALDVSRDAQAAGLPRLQDHVKSLPIDFDGLLARHAKIHGDIFNRMRLDLGGGADHKLPSEELIKRSRLGQLNTALLEKEFDAARYTILSSSGDLPPTLQGVWSGIWNPPWQSDYTHNGNVPSAIASMLMANMPECMESYLGYMESLMPHFRENARKLYGCRGIMVPSRTSAHGFNTHFNEEYIHLFWTTGSAWASHFFYDYYLYTGDREFLKNRGVPFMREAALFFEDFLREDANGVYIFSPSYSPENTPANSDSQACVNATMDIGLVKELFENLVSACEELSLHQEDVGRWKTMLSKMPDYQINNEGAVTEWTTPKLLDNDQHRHVSHLVPLFDGLPPEIASSQKLREAFRRVIESRMAPRRVDGGGVMSFGLVQLGQAAASLGEADLAYEAVDMLANVYWRSNMVSTHNPDEIFNVDICGGLPAVIIKMLVASQPGKITLLPALPSQWPKGRIEGALCRGQIELRRLAWDGSQVTAVLESQVRQTIELALPGGIESMEVISDSAKVRQNAKRPECFLLELPAGQPVCLKIFRPSQTQ